MLRKTQNLRKSNFSSLLNITFVQNRKHSHSVNLFNIYLIKVFLNPSTSN